MKKLFNKIKGSGLGASLIAVLIIIAIALAILAGSWLLVCGVIKLITLCFGWTFSWGLATGIWLAMFLLRSIFSSDVTVNK